MMTARIDRGCQALKQEQPQARTQAKPQAPTPSATQSNPPANSKNATDQVDSMGQPLHGPSHFNRLQEFGKILHSNDSLLTKLGKTASWATYNAPDAQQKAAEINARYDLTPDPRLAQIDQMESSPLGTIFAGVAGLFGASPRAQQAALDVGTATEGLGMGAAGGRLPFTGVRMPPKVPVQSEETALRLGPGSDANRATAQPTVAGKGANTRATLSTETQALLRAANQPVNNTGLSAAAR